MIELRHLGKTYPMARNGTSDAVVALRDINLTIEDGEIFGIIGLSGAGKSTLVRCINLLEKPTEGEVLIDGQDIMKISQQELLLLRRSIGMIFQGFNLLEQRTVLDNIAFAQQIAGVGRQQAREKARELLKLVSLEEKENMYPSQLSGGQKQRVAIARALANDPRYLLCDEATSALDPNTTRSILDLLKTINKQLGVTVVVITHEMKVIDQICDRVAVIDHSRIAECGRVADVFTSPRSQIARELILPQSRKMLSTAGGRRVRIIFDGNASQDPVISDLILQTQVPVNIMFADTKDMDGTAYGHMIVELPTDEQQAEKVLSWLRSCSNRIKWEEEVSCPICS